MTGVAIAVIAFASTGIAHAQTVVTETVVQPQNIEGSKSIDFTEFDVNKDGLYGREEVGEKLFYLFDQDGNQVIDNIEWDNRNIYTIVPLEKETYRFVDYNDDGHTDLTTYDYDVFYDETGLIRFDQNKNGLSAKEFIETPYLKLDTDNSTTIELDEWKKAYEERLSPLSADQDIYN
jgi:hypothetical protein